MMNNEQVAKTSFDTLKAYHNDYEWWIAADRDALKAMILKECGGKETDYDFDDYREVAPDASLSIWFEDGSIAEHGKGHKETKTVAEWIAFNDGPGFLCGTEF